MSRYLLREGGGHILREGGGALLLEDQPVSGPGLLPAKPRIAILNRGHPLARGLATALPFLDQGGAVAQDILGGVALSGDALFLPETDWIPGGGVQGRQSASMAAAAGLDGRVPLTVAVWGRMDTAGDVVALLGQDDGSDHRLFVAAEVLSEWHVGVGDTERTITPGPVPGRMHHVVLVLTGSAARVYIDGALRDSFAYAWTGASTAPWSVMAVNLGGGSIDRELDGAVADVKLSSSAWTARQVADLHADERSGRWSMYRQRPPHALMGELGVLG